MRLCPAVGMFYAALLCGSGVAQQTQVTLVTEASSDEMSWNRISTNIVTSSSPKSFYRIRAVTSSVSNNPFARSIIGNYPDYVGQDGMAVSSTIANETLYYNFDDPGGLPTYMLIHVGGTPIMYVTFGSNRIGQSFGLSITANGPLHYTAKFTTGDVYF